MSETPRGVCTECGQTKRLTKSGLVYAHTGMFAEELCEGGKKEPMPDPAMTLVKTGYTNEDLHEMLSNITPKRQKLRERISAWFHKVRGCCPDVDYGDDD